MSKMKKLNTKLAVYSIIGIFYMLLFTTGCVDTSKTMPEEVSDLPMPDSSGSTLMPSEPEIIFQADDEIRLIDLSLPENKSYKEWHDEAKKVNSERSDDFLSRKYDDGRTTKFYLTETIYILEENRSLFCVDEQTGAKRLAVQGGTYHNDYSETAAEKDKYEIVFFGEKINENKFAYYMVLGQVWYGCGIFDVSDFSNHIISYNDEEIQEHHFIGLYGEYVYTDCSMINPSTGDEVSRYCKTDINTYETTIIMPDLHVDYEFYWSSDFAPDGKLFATTHQLYMGENSTIGLRESSFEIRVFDVMSQKLLKTYTVYKNNISLSRIIFIDKNTIYIPAGGFFIEYDDDDVNEFGYGKYMLEVDISVICA